jgi:hypothetical protein
MSGNRILKGHIVLPFLMVLHGWNKLKLPIVMNTGQVGVIGIYINNAIIAIILIT